MSKATKNKRVNVPKDKKFAVIETLQGDADVLVEFIPNVWFITVNKKAVKVRESAECFYTRRTENQTVDQYIKHVKHAKFECLKPANDDKWMVLQCKVLKKGIASFTEAAEAEKFFSDFINTSDAEAEMREQASSPKRLRKTKKAKLHTPCESESDDEGGEISAKVVKIPDYNATFKAPVTHEEINSELMTVDNVTDTNRSDEPTDTNQADEPTDTNQIVSTNINEANQRPFDEIFRVSAEELPTFNFDLDNFSEIDDVDVNKTLISDTVTHSTSNGPHQIAGVGLGESPQIVFEFLDRAQNTSSKSNCNCSQKLMNKMDYMQKKFLKELGRVRQETSQAIRHFSDRYDVLLKSQEFQSPALAQQAASQAQDDEFEVNFKDSFPRSTKDLLIETNKTIQQDREYKLRLISKLERIISKENATEDQIIRQLLKAIGTSLCYSEFTWFGTEKKANFSELEALIGVITTIVERQLPKCDAYKAVKRIVQQRTKSAAEFEAKKRLNVNIVEENDGLDANDQGSVNLPNENPGSL